MWLWRSANFIRIRNSLIRIKLYRSSNRPWVAAVYPWILFGMMSSPANSSAFKFYTLPTYKRLNRLGKSAASEPVLWYNKHMKIPRKNIRRTCPTCGKDVGQMKNGHNRSGTQTYICGFCWRAYTPEPKRHAYDEEIREKAMELYRSGISGRAIGKILGMNKSNVHNWIRKSEQPWG